MSYTLLIRWDAVQLHRAYRAGFDDPCHAHAQSHSASMHMHIVTLNSFSNIKPIMAHVPVSLLMYVYESELIDCNCSWGNAELEPAPVTSWV